MIEDCPECGNPVVVPDDVEEDELVTCLTCGSTLEWKQDKLTVLQYVSEDFGE